jgi:hypothetical protein
MESPQNGTLLAPSCNYSDKLTAVTLVKDATIVKLLTTGIVNVCGWKVYCFWNVMAKGDARKEKWRGNKRMEWVTSKRHMTAEHRLARAVQTLQADVHSSPASSRVNWPPPTPEFKWTRPFGRKTKTGFCACAITFNPLNAGLNSVCHLVALLETRPILHVSKIRVKTQSTSHAPPSYHRFKNPRFDRQCSSNRVVCSLKGV